MCIVMIILWNVKFRSSIQTLVLQLLMLRPLERSIVYIGHRIVSAKTEVSVQGTGCFDISIVRQYGCSAVSAVSIPQYYATAHND